MTHPIGVFISYGRADDESFAKRLAHDLPDVWWDREAMENRGRTFLQEIRDAIAESDRLVLILGPEALASDYVAAEWRFALEACIPIVPVLRLSEYDDLPEELEKFHTVDAHEKRRSYRDALLELERILLTPVAPLGGLKGIDALPPHYVPRPEEMGRLGQMVLEDIQQPTVVTHGKQTTALWGMGGTGKSVLAAAFARACETRRAFADGIVWLRLGQRPNLALVLAAAGQALGDEDSKAYLDPLRGASRLAQLMREKNVLLVVDDAWEVEHVVPFRNAVSAHPRCRLLVTTRDGGLATNLGARRHEIRELTDDQAPTLLARWANVDPELLPGEASAIVEECGNLPLALAMIGAMLRGRPGRWANALHKLRNADLDRIRREFPNYPYPSLLRSIKVSVDALAPEVHTRYLDLAIFPDGTPVPPSVLERLWGLESFDTEDVVDALVDRSLARTDDNGALTLHDLQRDYVRQQVGNLSTVHQRLLDAYAADFPSWARGANDGYFFENLAHHLIGAGRRDELVRLLTSSPKWLEAKFASCQGDGPFLADVQLALATDSVPLVEFVKLRCLKQVAGERTSLYTDVDLETLVNLGQKDDALAHARLRDSEADRFQGLRVIYDSVEDPEELLDALHDAARAIRDDEERTWALCDLASRLHQAGDGRLEGALQEARALAEAYPVPGTQADMFRRLGAILIEVGRPDEAIALVDSISHFWSFAPALYGLGRILERRGDERAATVLKDARRKASSMRVDRSEARDLGKLAAVLAQSGCIEKAQKMIAALPEQAYSEKSDAMDALAGAFADEGRFDEAIDAAHAADGLGSSVNRTEQVLAMMVEAGQLDEAEKEVRKLRSRAIPMLIKLAVARATNDDDRADALFDRAAKIARSAEDERDYDLHNLAKGLAEAGRLDQAEAAAHEIAAPWKRAEALRDLALVLAKSGDARTRSIFEEARETACSTERTGPRSDALRALATLFAGAGDFARALELARRIPNANPRTGALRDLVRSMYEAGDPQAAEVSEQARASAQAVDPHLDYGKVRVRDLGELALTLSRFGDTRGAAVLAEAREAARAIENPTSRFEALSLLARLVAEADAGQAVEVLEEAWASAKTAAKIGEREHPLLQVALAFAELGLPDQSAKVARNLEESSSKLRGLRAEALARARLNDERADGVFEAAYKITSFCEEDKRDFALAELAETLAEAKRFDFAERVIGEIGDEDEVSNAERGLASALAAEGRFDRGLDLARSLARRGEGNEALLAAGTALAQAGDPRASAVLTEAWEVARGDYEYAPFKARLLLGVASRLAEVKDSRAGDAFQEARQAIRDVAADSYDRPKLFRELAEMMARADEDCADAVFEEAVAAARSYDHEASRVDFLDKLAEALARHGHLRRALDACDFTSLDSMIEKLAQWLPHTQESPEIVSAVLGETLRIAGWVRGYWLEIKPLVEARVSRAQGSA